jgi:hypothetical protein
MMTVNAKVKDASVLGSKYPHPPTRISVQKAQNIHAQ